MPRVRSQNYGTGAPQPQHRPPNKGKRNKNLFKLREFTVHQEHCGMKVGTDALLLAGYSFTDERATPLLWQDVWGGAEFSSVAIGGKEDYYGTRASLQHVRNVLEIGCGSGVISLLLAQQFPEATIHCVDIDRGAVAQCLVNVAALEQEQWRARMRVYHTPIQEFDPAASRPVRLCSGGNRGGDGAQGERREAADGTEDDNSGGEETAESGRDGGEAAAEIKAEAQEAAEETAPVFEEVGEEEFAALAKCETFDLILCSPPYFPTDHTKDRFVAAMDSQRRVARHTHTLSMAELVGVVERRLTPDVGAFNVICSVIQPAKELRELFMASTELRLEEEVEVSDCPGSKTIRMMYRSVRPSGGNCGDKGEPEKRGMTIYARSHKEDPQVHRTYSHQYRCMLYKFCSHIPSDEEAAPPAACPADAAGEERADSESEAAASAAPELRVRIAEPEEGVLLRSPAAAGQNDGRWAQAGRSPKMAAVNRRLSVQRIASLVSRDLEHPQLTGFVLKKKRHRKISAWNNRLFVLRDGILKVYLSEQDQGVVPPRRAFHMREVDVRLMEEGGCEHEHSFYLDVASVDCFYIIALETREELDKWTTTLNKARSAARELLEEELTAMALQVSETQ